MRRRKMVYLDAELLRAVQMAAAQAGKKDYQVIHEALRGHLGLIALEPAWARSEFSDDAALRIAYEETHASRRPKPRRRRG
jgi:hypothetical protein